MFFRLGALRPGDTVDVTRADHTVAVFRVDRVVSYPKDHFPTLEVYGNTDHAALRLITCGGKFDFSTPQLREQHRRLRLAGLQPPGVVRRSAQDRPPRQKEVPP